MIKTDYHFLKTHLTHVLFIFWKFLCASKAMNKVIANGHISSLFLVTWLLRTTAWILFFGSLIFELHCVLNAVCFFFKVMLRKLFPKCNFLGTQSWKFTVAFAYFAQWFHQPWDYDSFCQWWDEGMYIFKSLPEFHTRKVNRSYIFTSIIDFRCFHRTHRKMITMWGDDTLISWMVVIFHSKCLY